MGANLRDRVTKLTELAAEVHRKLSEQAACTPEMAASTRAVVELLVELLPSDPVTLALSRCGRHKVPVYAAGWQSHPDKVERLAKRFAAGTMTDADRNIVARLPPSFESCLAAMASLYERV